MEQNVVTHKPKPRLKKFLKSKTVYALLVISIVLNLGLAFIFVANKDKTGEDDGNDSQEMSTLVDSYPQSYADVEEEGSTDEFNDAKTDIESDENIQVVEEKSFTRNDVEIDTTDWEGWGTTAGGFGFEYPGSDWDVTYPNGTVYVTHTENGQLTVAINTSNGIPSSIPEGDLVETSTVNFLGGTLKKWELVQNGESKFIYYGDTPLQGVVIDKVTYKFIATSYLEKGISDEQAAIFDEIVESFTKDQPTYYEWYLNEFEE